LWRAWGEAGGNDDSGNPHLLSAILTKLTGMSTLDYAKAKLLGPLGIKDKDVVEKKTPNNLENYNQN
jgi:CubicO group peptidase (beta-lactamase class C family)